MKTLLVVLLVLIVAAVVAAIMLQSRRRDGPWPFYAKKPLTQPEQVLYHRLVKALPECIVLSQVQASRVLGVKKGVNFASWHNRISRLSIDFLICLKDATIVAAVELDDSSHDGPRRREADQRKERALTAAGIRLVRWSVKELPSEAAIKDAFSSASLPPFVAER
jgi:very-short-patch-repair endonuclease